MSLKTIEHDRALCERLMNAAESGRVLHAYLLTGPKDRTEEIAMAFAKALLCDDPREGCSCGTCSSCRRFDHSNHEDMIVVKRDTGRLLTQDIEQLQSRLIYRPYGRRRVVVICDADTMQQTPQNKLLKTLEEPSGDTVFILLAERRDALLATVLSRCSSFAVSSGSAPSSDVSLACAAKFAELYAGRAPFYRLKEAVAPILDEKDEQRRLALEFAEIVESVLSDALLIRSGAEAAACGEFGDIAASIASSRSGEELIKAVKLAEGSATNIKLSYSAGYALKSLCLNI